MKMQKRQFRIGELAQSLNVEKFVIRFWEKEFNVSTTRSQGGQRFYDPQDVETFKHIKSLLYDQGFTIAGAKQHLKTTQPKEKTFEHRVMGSHKTSFDITEHTITQLLVLKDKLIQLKKHL